MALVITLTANCAYFGGKAPNFGGAVVILVLNLFSTMHGLFSAKLGNFESSIIEKVPPKDKISNFLSNLFLAIYFLSSIDL